LRRRAPTVRFMTFDTLTTGVRDLECALSVRKSSFVHGLMTRRALLAVLGVLAAFALFNCTMYLWYHRGKRVLAPMATC
jgi:hypothetical protein